MTSVAFFGDRNVIPALHVAIASSLAALSGPDPLKIYLFYSGLKDEELNKLHQTAAMNGDRGELKTILFDSHRVARWRSLYGSLMPYGRLFLPDLLAEEKTAIYLDADVIVDLDLNQILPKDIEETPLYAMPAWDFAHSHDAKLAGELNIAEKAQYYHSGCLVMNLELWRRNKIVERCCRFGDLYSQRLLSHDQTILNFVCLNNIKSIDSALFTHLYPLSNGQINYAAGKIHNFCGSPKPFDPFGNVLNDHYSFFVGHLKNTAIAGWSPNDWTQLRRMMRNWRLLRPIVATSARMLARRVS